MSESKPSLNPWVPRTFAWWFAALVFLGSFTGVTLGWGTFALGDFDVFGYPLAHHHRESFLRGEIPLWNPLNNFGLPFLAQWNTMVLYPGSLLYVFLPLSWSLGFFCVLHLYLGGLGMYRLTRGWTGSDFGGAVAGIAYAFSGLTQTALMWPNNSAALGWLPWVLLAVETGCRRGGRSLFAAVLVGAMQMLTGAPEIILFTWILIALRLVLTGGLSWRRLSLRFGTIVVLVALLCAAQLWPFLDLLLHSQRTGGTGETQWAAGPFVWGNYFVPLLRTVKSSAGTFYQADQFWVVSTYAGVGTLMFAVTGAGLRRDRWLVALAVVVLVAFVLSMGTKGFLYPLFDKLLPLGVMRYPAKFLVLVAVALPVFAAYGVKAVAETPIDQKRCPLLPALLLVTAGWAISMFFVKPLNVTGETTQPIFMNGCVRLCLLFSCWGFACAWRKKADTQWTNWLGIGVVLVLWADLKTQQPALTPVIDRSNYADAVPIAPKPGLDSGRAMLTARALGELKSKSLPDLGQTTVLHRLSLFDNLNLVEGVAKMDGLFSLYLPRQQEVESLVYAGPHEVREPLADFVGITHLSSPTNIFAWSKRNSAMPIVSTGQEPMFLGAEEIPAALAAVDFNPRQQVFLPQAVRERAPTGANLAIRSTKITTHRIEIEVSAETSGIITIAQAHYHPWIAEIDGEPTEILPANHAFQAVAVPTGEHRVVLEYRDTTWRMGCVVSLLTIIGLCLAALRLHRKETIASA